MLPNAAIRVLHRNIYFIEAPFGNFSDCFEKLLRFSGIEHLILKADQCCIRIYFMCAKHIFLIFYIDF